MCFIIFFDLHGLFLELSWKDLSDHKESLFILWWKPKDTLERSHDRCFSIHQQLISLTYRHAHPNTWTSRHDCYSLVATVFLRTLFITESTSISTWLCLGFLSSIDERPDAFLVLHPKEKITWSLGSPVFWKRWQTFSMYTKDLTIVHVSHRKFLFYLKFCAKKNIIMSKCNRL